MRILDRARRAADHAGQLGDDAAETLAAVRRAAFAVELAALAGAVLLASMLLVGAVRLSGVHR